MKKQLWLGVAAAAMIISGSQSVVAQETTSDATTLGGPMAVDASTIVGKDLHDAQGNDIGDIDAVMVNADGAVQSVVVDVSGWLEGEKLINLNWSDLAEGPDGEIVAKNLTKEQAESAEGYAYREGQRGGQVLTENGEPYTGMVAVDTANDGRAPETGPNAIMNGDGTFNTSNVLGAAIESGAGDKIGEVNEVVIDPSGKVQGVVVDVGGLLGVGAHSVLLDWQEIAHTQRDGKEVLTVNATEEALKKMPEYEPRTTN